MEFIGHAYNVQDLKNILEDLPDYYFVVNQSDGQVTSPVEVYKDESRQDIVLK